MNSPSDTPTPEPDDEWAAMLAAASKPVEDAQKPRPLVWGPEDELQF